MESAACWIPFFHLNDKGSDLQQVAKYLAAAAAFDKICEIAQQSGKKFTATVDLWP